MIIKDNEEEQILLLEYPLIGINDLWYIFKKFN